MPGSAVRRCLFAPALLVALLVGFNAPAGATEPAVLDGAITQPLVLDEALLKSLPPVTIDVSFETGEGRKSGTCTGVRLWSLLEKAKTVDAAERTPRFCTR